MGTRTRNNVQLILAYQASISCMWFVMEIPLILAVWQNGVLKFNLSSVSRRGKCLRASKAATVCWEHYWCFTAEIKWVDFVHFSYMHISWECSQSWRFQETRLVWVKSQKRFCSDAWPTHHVLKGGLEILGVVNEIQLCKGHRLPFMAGV